MLRRYCIVAQPNPGAALFRYGRSRFHKLHSAGNARSPALPGRSVAPLSDRGGRIDVGDRLLAQPALWHFQGFRMPEACVTLHRMHESSGSTRGADAPPAPLHFRHHYDYSQCLHHSSHFLQENSPTVFRPASCAALKMTECVDGST